MSEESECLDSELLSRLLELPRDDLSEMNQAINKLPWIGRSNPCASAKLCQSSLPKRESRSHNELSASRSPTCCSPST